jgi:hypothetical protein
MKNAKSLATLLLAVMFSAFVVAQVVEEIFKGGRKSKLFLCIKMKLLMQP